ncbi:TPA: molecular chaperone DnaK suppressor DksA [Candidatus Dependentiae bacterium]|nr:MAG: DnaK suppressor protein [candidate division TM6 bacterium GW2011_GWE2_31_21]KKP54110.1 MAG: DnaK suppressor protein [candidate division TM6 bacterium GW2011_GWF2_33_332]HBS48308.1 molecular chaperone DnaK suppressor DksA [Candidatus Dependentiae bacterium]HBZ73018.1 molecular chaperone DnaK suppressor DksA [Candidatus Dependentiae bacterium]
MEHRFDFINKMKSDLLKKRSELTTLLASITKEDWSEKSQIKDSADEALSSSMDKLQSSLEATEIDELKLIENALIRIEKNEYGICLDCGQPINSKRLEIYPYAARCIACQEALEK